MKKFAQNWNGNIVCAIDTETTGNDPKIHEVIEIAIVALDSNFIPRTDMLPFNIKIKPDKLEYISNEAMKINKINLPNLILTGFERFKAADLLDEWFAQLKLAPGKKILPLAQFWTYDKEFIKEWIGIENFDFIFDYHYRDTGVIAQYINDRAVMHEEKPPFPKVNLSYLCSQLEIQNLNRHTALGDCVAVAAVYRQMLMNGPLLM